MFPYHCSFEVDLKQYKIRIHNYSRTTLKTTQEGFASSLARNELHNEMLARNELYNEVGEIELLHAAAGKQQLAKDGLIPKQIEILTYSKYICQH
jgi:hypothetical protein